MTPTVPLRVLTYNVHRCVGVDRRLDVGRVAAVIAALRPDVVALQELDVGRARTGRVDQAHDLARRLGMRHHFNAALRVEAEAYGDAILSRLPERLVRQGALPFYDRLPGLETRGALWVAVQLPGGGELQVVNTHLGLLPREQERQAAALLGPDWLLDDRWAAPGVLVGDFNAPPPSLTWRLLRAALRDGQARVGRAPLATFPSRFPLLRIDHLFHTGGVEVAGVEAPLDPLSRVASDHLPLLFELRVRDQTAESAGAGMP